MSDPSARMADLAPQQKRALLSQLLQRKAGQAAAVLPLSYNQQALWVLSRLAPESWAYNVLFSARVRSTVDITALQRAFQAVLECHPSLRTTHTEHHGQPEQHVHKHPQLSFKATDASTWREDALMTYITKEARRPFDLEHGPLMRVHVCTRAVEDHILLLVIHHIAVDLWSLGLLLDDLRLLYPAVQAGVQASLSPLTHEYAEYVRWQAAMLASAEGEQLWAYWRQRLAGAASVLSLPIARPRPPVQTYNGASHVFTLPASLTRQLKELAKTQGVTLHTLLLATFYVLLYRYTGQEDISVGTFMAGRMRPEFRRVVGYFANPVVLRADLSGHPAFATFLKQVHHTGLAALRHQDFPFSLLVERLQPARDASRSPLFQVAFVLQQLHRQEEFLPYFVPGAATPQLDFGGLALEPFVLPQQEGQFDLTLEMTEINETLYGGLKYNTDLFEATTMARMAGHFQTLLEGLVNHPDQRLSALPLLTAEESHQLLVAWNNTQTDARAVLGIHQLFEAQVECTPEAIALVYKDQRLTYRELNQRANQLAHSLQLLGVGPEVLVGICLERSVEMVIGVLGILKAGGAYVPLDPAYPKARLAFILQDAQVRVLLTQQQLHPRLPVHTAQEVCLDTHWDTMAQEHSENLTSPVTANNLAYIIYTSGSTGMPKGVAIEHRNTVALLEWARRHFAPEHCAGVLASTSLCFDLSVFELFVPLSWGGTVILAENLFQLPQLSAAHDVTLVNTVPSVLTEFLRLHRLPASVRTVNLAGEPLQPSLVEQVYQSAQVRQVYDLYGPTEDTTYSTCALRSRQGPATIGRPIANTQVYILDPHLHPVPVGIPGELHLGGAGLARGYLNRPELTAAKFIPHPFSTEPGARLYKTGDLVRYLPDGNLEFLGRLDHQVKVRGIRIELGEIEAALGQYAAVQEAVVTVREDVPGEKRLVAYLVLVQEPGTTLRALRHFLREKLPDYMIPAVFVMLDALPLTPNGKIDRRALPAPERELPAPAEAFVAPRTPLEQTLAEIWAHVLGMPQVGRHDNFFELGGHSLLAVQLLSRVQQTFGPTLPLATLFQAPTVADFALLLADVPHHLAYPLVPLRTAGNQPPLFCMHPAGGQVMVYQSLAACLGADQPLYGLQSRALTEGTQEHTTLDEMVADYAAAIRAQQPKGPYYLLGWSMGGLLSLAVAKVLERQGQQVAFNGLLDAYLPAKQDLPWGSDPFLELLLTFGGTMASALMALAPNALQALRDELLALSPLERLQCLVAWGRERHLLTSTLPLEHLQRQAALTETHVNMLGAHRITPVQAPLYIWWARNGLWGTPSRPDWSRYALGSLHTEIAAGNHFSMLQPPHVKILAERLTACLQHAQALTWKGPTPSTITLKSGH